MIETKDLSFTYPAEEGKENPPALRGVNIAIEKGSFTVVLGHNGSGKSTLAKTFNAVVLPSGGHVYVKGMDTLDESLLLAVRQRVGMVFQNPDNQIVANVDLPEPLCPRTTVKLPFRTEMSTPFNA